ncbi:MAG: aspartate carbamoyltransferase [Chloroflexi bacterium]|nr:aspartate carbamoyltransferase [Chloroflexota bacterium]
MTPIPGNPFYGRDILSVDQFARDDLEYIFGVAESMRGIARGPGSSVLLRGKVLSCLFYEPSTRTSSSFVAAMSRLGGSVIPINEVHYSSVTKGESLPDTIRTLECYSDVIVLRHPETGSARIAADFARIPVINAGDGIGEHPTQALLDLFTIQEELGHIDGLSVVMVGDLKYGRTVHSLARLLSLYNVKILCVSPDVLRMPERIVAQLQERGIPTGETADLERVITDADVLYVTRVQKERFEDQALYERVKGSYVITPHTLRRAKEKMVVMHPLPRVGEISYEVDSDPRAAYFRQMENRMYIRMALLAAVLGKA